MLFLMTLKKVIYNFYFFQNALQHLCDALKENESLTIAHLAVKLDFKSVLSHPTIEP